MSHDSGFRRNDHDSTHGPATQKRGRNKASRAFEDRMRRRYDTHEKMRKLMEDRKANPAEG
jgi:hypothetical protein